MEKYNINIQTEDGGVKIIISDIGDEPYGKVIIADYDESGALLAVSAEDISSEISHPLSDNVYTVKAFIWNTLEEMYPLSESVKKDIYE